jgi:perosamine synthetase
VANVVEILGARPVFIDSKPGGFNMDVCRIENNITAQTRAILIVHNFGFPVEIGRIQALSAKYDIPVVEDAACALGSSIKGIKCGSLGRLATISFHPRKLLTTGEGGAVVTDDINLAKKVRLLRNHGREYGNDNEFVIPGFNSRMTEFQAALGVSQMKRFGNILKDRIKAALYYNDQLADLDFIRPHLPEANSVSNFQAYVLRVAGGLKNEITNHLSRHNIEAGVGNHSIPHTGYYKEKYNFGNSHYPESLSAFNSIISLPLYEGITTGEQDRVIEALRKFAHCKSKSPELQAVESI